MDDGLNRITEQLTRPITKTSPRYYALVFVLASLFGIGVVAWIRQLALGLGVTGLNTSVTWGIYITNFVFFIGISHAGTLISAILRVTNAEWRRPITRAAEAITVFALMMGAVQIIFDMGRPDRALNVVLYGRLGSPLLWDVICISIYLLSCIFYLFLPLLPDLGILANMENMPNWRKKLYNFLSFGWKDTSEQKRRLEKAINVMAIFIIPLAISVHTVVSWVFGMTVRPMWHSSIFGPYFVTGAIFSGIAAIIVAMAIIRKVYRLENYLKPIQFDNLAKLLLAMSCLWFYFTFTEYLTIGYGALTDELAVFNAKVTGEFSVIFWSMVTCMTLAFLLLIVRKKRVIGATTLASVFVIIGMWLERFSIVVPTLTKRLDPVYQPAVYHPTSTEWLITLASISGFVLLYTLFVKFFPIISIWEVKEGKEAIPAVVKRIESYLPAEVAK